MADKPIFFDSTGRRAARVAFIAWALAVISVLLASGFVASLVVVPEMENINLRGRLTAIHMPELEKKAQAPGLLRFAARLAAEASDFCQASATPGRAPWDRCCNPLQAGRYR
jgi:hypothetical protein